MLDSIRFSIPQDILYYKAYLSYLFRLWKIRLTSTHIDRRTVLSWLRSRNIFFVVGLGRSGTNWLAHLLMHDNKADVYHEPFDETIPSQYSYIDESFPYNYFWNFRIFEIYFRANKEARIYGEVNSYLRRFVKAIKVIIPNAKLLYLVRDGRDVVRSMYNRFTMMNNAYDTRLIKPKEGDPLYIGWKRLPRFAKLCWYWTNENKNLLDELGEPIKFELIVSDYEYLKERVLKPLNLDIPYEIWDRFRRIRLNISRRRLLPHWREWGVNMRYTFEVICGEVMTELGYELNWSE